MKEILTYEMKRHNILIGLLRIQLNAAVMMSRNEHESNLQRPTMNEHGNECFFVCEEFIRYFYVCG
jgi:hypothetical protein